MAERRKATRKAGTKARKTTAASASPKKKRPDGSISSGIYDAVEKLVADGKMKRAAAFRQLAKKTGRKEGTVAVNYYYAAKKRGKKMLKRPRGGKRAVTARTAGQPRALALLGTLEALVRKQAAELEALRRENGRFAEVRKFFARGA